MNVRECVRDQACDVGLALAQRSMGAVRDPNRCGRGMLLLTERKPDRRIPAQALAGSELGLEPRLPERCSGRLLRL